MQQPPWMAEAWALFGASEIAGPRANSRIADLYRDAGHASVRDDAVPWCAAFVGACLKRAGIRPTGSLRARSYLKFGVAAEVPKPGDVVVLTRGASPTAGHVGFLVGETETRVLLLGGNQSNAVTVAAFSRDRILGFRRPALDAQPTSEVGNDHAPRTTEDAFAPCLAHVLRMEGGYVNDPYDPGGPTHRGITLATFARYRKTPNFTEARRALVADLKAIKDEEVRAIYEAFYWRPSRAQEMPAGVDLMHFDASVNHGLTGAARLLQSTLGVTVDGEIGPVTMGALRASDPSQTIAAYADARAKRYRSLRHFWRFGRGWLRRTDATRVAALARAVEAAGDQAPNTLPSKPTTRPDMTTSTPNSSSPDAKPSKWWMESITLWGAFITTLSTVLPIVGPLFGLHLSSTMIEQIGAHVVTILQALGGISGVLLTVFGRFRATHALR